MMVTNPLMIRPRETYVRKLHDGTVLEAEVSPCVFMHAYYPLQLTVTLRLANGAIGGTAHPSNRGLTATTSTLADVHSLLESVGTVLCSRCSTPAFDPAKVETNRNGLCEPCFMAELKAELGHDLETERRQLAERDRAQKAAGMRFRATAWIHGSSGDDKLVDWYFSARPSDSGIQKLLRDEGSVIVYNYEIIAL